MFFPRVILNLALATFFPLTIAAQFTTSLLTPNTDPTLQLRDHNATLALPSSSKTLQSAADTVVARYVEETPTFIGKVCPGSQDNIAKADNRDDWAWGDAYSVHLGIQWLRYPPLGKPKNGKGPRNCGRVSCSGNTAIYWCNNDPGRERELPAWSWIADGANAIYRDSNCWQYGTKYYMHEDEDGRVKGEIYSDQTWSVFIRGESCAKPGKTQ